MEIEKVEDILLDGTEGEIRSLEGSSIEYSYSPKYGDYSIKTERELLRAHGLPYTPNCVKLYGNEHTF